jgi:hypothetical protein
MRLMVAVPADQSGVAGVGKKKFQRRRLDVAVAKYHVGFTNLISHRWTRMKHRFTNFKTAHLHPVVWVLSLEITALNHHRQDLSYLSVRGRVDSN